MARTVTYHGTPRPEFPRPDFERSQWFNLNGEWDFGFDDQNEGLAARWHQGSGGFDRTIIVPFCYQSRLSGIEVEETHEFVWYRRRFDRPRGFESQRVLLKFGAVDYRATVWLNGDFVCEHEGGYTPFGADVTAYLKDTGNVLVVRVEDKDDATQPRGKQSWRGGRFGCWYTPTSGIWQTVWLEAVGESHLEYLQIDTDLDQRQVAFTFEVEHFQESLEILATISFRGRVYKTVSTSVGDGYPSLLVRLDWPDELDLEYRWHPDRPNLFDVEFSLRRGGIVLDRVKSYFGMRKIQVQNGLILLNNVPYTQKLILDQGYWVDGLLTAPSDEAFVRDIELAKEFGFNGARKHQKMEDPRYYYHADRLGLLVWGEMPSHYRFTERAMARSTAEWQHFIRRDRNHPSIVAWVPINESWGVSNILNDPRMQDFSRTLYRLTRALDPSRFVSSNDGWEQVDSDICAIHDYEASGANFVAKSIDIERLLETKSDWRMIYARGSQYGGEPILLTEYGGIAFAGGGEGTWGYNGTVKSVDEFMVRFTAITRAALDHPRLQGICYTQLADVQQEINGLVTPDRKPKIDPALIRNVLQQR